MMFNSKLNKGLEFKVEMGLLTRLKNWNISLSLEKSVLCPQILLKLPEIPVGM